MRRILSLVLVFALTASCIQRSKYRQVVAQMDSLAAANEEQDRRIEALESCMQEISGRMDSLSRQKKILYLPGPGPKDKPLSKSPGKSPAPKDKQISTTVYPHTDVTTHTDTITVIQPVNDDRTQALATQDMLLNQAWFCIGNRKELVDNGVRMGMKTNYSAIDKSFLMPVDIREFRSVLINSSKARIITPMPEASYRLRPEGGRTTLEITDPGLFWSNSNILIILTDATSSPKQK